MFVYRQSSQISKGYRQTNKGQYDHLAVTRAKHNRWRIIDAIGPFFHGYQREVINWSSIPFHHLEKGGRLDTSLCASIFGEFASFIKRVQGVGYNTITIDNLAHLVTFDFYSQQQKKLWKDYNAFYHTLIRLAKDAGMRVLITSDIMFFNDEIERKTGNRSRRILDILKQAVEQLFCEYEVDGLIFRIGESDGIDVEDQVRSRLVIKTPQMLNSYIRELLPTFEEHRRYLFLRTWTVGAYPVGDLMWNPKTFNRAFRSIESDYFVLSMKYGVSDFFRSLEINPLFFASDHKKIIELQAKREYDGFGRLPYYVGWDYARYRDQLKKAQNMVGISVWCQSGGWSTWNERTFIDDHSPWNVLNTKACVDIFSRGISPDAVIAREHSERMVRFLREYHRITNQLLYEGIKPGYFRRVRLPPLLWLYWDHIIVTPLMRSLHKTQQVRITPGDIERLAQYGRRAGVKDLVFIIDTVDLFRLCRQSLSGNDVRDELVERSHQYRKKYPYAYQFTIDDSQRIGPLTRVLLYFAIRRKAQYRMVDWILLNRVASLLLRMLAYLNRRRMPGFARTQAMGIGTVLR